MGIFKDNAGTFAYLGPVLLSTNLISNSSTAAASYLKDFWNWSYLKRICGFSEGKALFNIKFALHHLKIVFNDDNDATTTLEITCEDDK